MTEDVITDLKQFITATVSQQTIELEKKFDHKIDQLDHKLSSKIDALSAAVAEALDAANEATATQLRDHERRIVRLEHTVHPA
ncbi:MAG TPA: hypothetical protein VJP80_02110 [Candidatus Saccharimonadales bacterium]|nr:hypothetical protein [Candidatus Saccharimonadales bacterium]